MPHEFLVLKALYAGKDTPEMVEPLPEPQFIGLLQKQYEEAQVVLD